MIYLPLKITREHFISLSKNILKLNSVYTTELSKRSQRIVIVSDIAKYSVIKTTGEQKAVMASDTCRQPLKKIREYLVAFDRTPKEADGRRVTAWVRAGEQVFGELAALGAACGWQYARLHALPEARDIVAAVSANRDWLRTFLNVYPDIRIDLELTQPAGVVCRTRSGIEVLLRGFAAVDRDFDKVLRDLEELGEVDELDRCLRVWRTSGHRPDFEAGEKRADVPLEHWWWH